LAGRSGSTFQKRQKELARIEKRRDKAARKEQRKSDTKDEPGGGPPIEPLDPADVGLPELEQIGEGHASES
jgi:hypothetical protein